LREATAVARLEPIRRLLATAEEAAAYTIAHRRSPYMAAVLTFWRMRAEVVGEIATTAPADLPEVNPDT
jgi:hypothetical protein